MGIQFYNGLSNYNNYRIDIPKVNPEDIKAKELTSAKADNKALEKNEAASGYSVQDSLAADQRSRVANLEDVSLTFNKEDSFDYIGSESSVKSLDMQKAISDMKKDGILQEYQYFVGDSKSLYSDEDGIVIPKNNF